MPRGHEHDPIYSPFTFSQKKIVMEKKNVVPCLDVTMITFFYCEI